MSETSRTADRYPIQGPKSFNDIVGSIHELTRRVAQPLEGGDHPPDQHDPNIVIIDSLGLRVPLENQAKKIRETEAAIALYTADRAGEQSRAISDATGFEVNALGHLEFSRVKPMAETSGTFYFLTDGNVLVMMDGQVKGDDPLSEDSEACYDLLNFLGLGDFWVKNLMFKHELGKTTGAEGIFFLDEAPAVALRDFLASYVNPPSEGESNP